MNTPNDQFYRAARINQDPIWKFLLKAYLVPKYAKMFTNLILFPKSVFARSTQTVVELAESVFTHNNPDLREIPISSAFSSGTARAYAKLYGILANGGTEEGNKLLSDKSINKLATPIVSGVDLVTGLYTSYRVGMQLNNPNGGVVFGHPGHGGQVAQADLENGIGLAYLTNYIDVYAQGDHPRYLALVQEFYVCLENYLKNKQ
ncbi:beta-lactamase domain-containing protein 2-like [Ruditapes philippinarum]|uniref:beta-lactamase domain-containing protein 2-like n=1 Tax=Ruditapes philippinarum TaxID=129788 RepID=UPI00295BB1AD|nr:beta-lactamase domain-containing protein 2-like [Ruditapes philippinarum]